MPSQTTVLSNVKTAYWTPQARLENTASAKLTTHSVHRKLSMFGQVSCPTGHFMPTMPRDKLEKGALFYALLAENLFSFACQLLARHHAFRPLIGGEAFDCTALELGCQFQGQGDKYVNDQCD